MTPVMQDFLKNDVGFVHLGQPTAVKLDAISFTRFGAVLGRIIRISSDAMPGRNCGPPLRRPCALIDGQSASMNVTFRSRPHCW